MIHHTRKFTNRKKSKGDDGFFENDELLVPFEKPLFKLLITLGYSIKQEQRKLVQSLKTTVTPHGNQSETLFSKIMKLTTSNE